MCPIHEDVELLSICCGAPIRWGHCEKCKENVGEGWCPVCEEEVEL